jgi:hypothetical protein
MFPIAALAGPLLSGIASSAVSSLLPSLIGQGVQSLFQDMIKDAVKGAIDQIGKQCGMPKFIQNILKECVDKATGGCQKPGGDVLDFVKDKVGGKLENFAKELLSDIVDAFKNHKAECDKKEGGKAGGKSWFVALMTALGELQNKQAEKLQKLQAEVSDSLGSGDGSAGSQKAQFDKMEEFKAEGKLMDVLSQVVKSIGDSISQALSTVARAQ